MADVTRPSLPLRLIKPSLCILALSAAVSIYLGVLAWALMTGRMALAIGLILVAAALVGEDLTCVGAGLLVARRELHLPVAIAACFIGIVLGDVLLYAAGRWLGRPALAAAPLRWIIRPRAIEPTARWLAHRGPWVIVLGRFVPGLRLPTYFAAGLARLPARTVVGLMLAAAAVWTPLLVTAAAVVGHRLQPALALYDRYALWVVAEIVVLMLLVTRIVLPSLTWQGRRRLLGRWRRLVRWEFWPMWAFYPPVVAWIFWLGLKHRGLTVFTAANPGIPDGGFIGESKHAILAALAPAGDVVPRHRVIAPAADAAARTAALDAFLAEDNVAYPIVLKPDVGQRGAGVRVIRGGHEARDYLATVRGPVIAQQFAPGQEFGVFYVRHPDEATGRIFSITEKVLPAVVGDGVRTLQALILSDPRAVCMAAAYEADNAGRLFDVPSAGERVTLVQVGTHARGAIFRDGNWAATAALEAAIDRISRAFPGFFIGRYDLRTPSVEDFMAGRNFRIVELNGVTAEATDIYDPANTVFKAWRTLARQWSLAFEIGAANRARGAPLTPLTQLLRNARAYEAVD